MWFCAIDGVAFHGGNRINDDQGWPADLFSSSSRPKKPTAPKTPGSFPFSPYKQTDVRAVWVSVCVYAPGQPILGLNGNGTHVRPTTARPLTRRVARSSDVSAPQTCGLGVYLFFVLSLIPHCPCPALSASTVSKSGPFPPHSFFPSVQWHPSFSPVHVGHPIKRLSQYFQALDCVQY